MADPDNYLYSSPSSSSARLSPRLSSTSVRASSQLADASSVRSRGRRQESSIRDGAGDGGADDGIINSRSGYGYGNSNSNSNNENKNNNNRDVDIGAGPGPFGGSSSASGSSHWSGRGMGVRNQERMQPIRNRGSGLLAASQHHPLESPSGSRPSSRCTGRSASREAAGAKGFGKVLGDSLSQSWTSVQGLAASLIAAGEEQMGAVGLSRGKNWSQSPKLNRWTWDRPEGDRGASAGHAPGVWGPAPPSQRPGIDDVAAGSSADREAALKAARTASVLESHRGANGGLDVTGNYKRRNSDDVAQTAPAASQPEEHLVYVHQVRPSDTYAGLILRYKCRGDAFKKANGLWSNDSIQMRKWVTFPVDACELRGRPCEAPTRGLGKGSSARTTSITMPTKTMTTATTAMTNILSVRWSNGTGTILEDPLSCDTASTEAGTHHTHNEYSDHDNNHENDANHDDDNDKDRLWTHVKWVRVDSFPEPVEIGRVSRQAMGYFPPRRKRSVTTTTTSSVSASTPRQSSDTANPASSPVGWSSTRRHSSITSQSRSLASAALSRTHATTATDSSKPAWMRRPGGIGSMEHNVRAPGPEKDSLNRWMERHMPSLNIDQLPSMSIMGSETARLGFGPSPHGSAGIVESPFEQGRDASANAIAIANASDGSGHGGIGLDKAAMAVESWLRGALSRHPGSPMTGGMRGRSASQDEGVGIGDLIELSQHSAGDHSEDESREASSSERRDRSPAGETSQRAALVSEGFRSRKTDRNPF